MFFIIMNIQAITKLLSTMERCAEGHHLSGLGGQPNHVPRVTSKVTTAAHFIIFYAIYWYDSFI